MDESRKKKKCVLIDFEADQRCVFVFKKVSSRIFTEG